MCHHHVCFSSESSSCTVLTPCCRTVSGYETDLTKSLIVSVLFEGRVIVSPVLPPLVGELDAPTLATRIDKLSPVSGFQKEPHRYRRSTRWMQPCAFRYTAQYKYNTELHCLFSQRDGGHMCEVVCHILFSGAHEIFTVFRHQKETLSWKIYSCDSLPGWKHDINMSDDWRHPVQFCTRSSATHCCLSLRTWQTEDDVETKQHIFNMFQASCRRQQQQKTGKLMFGTFHR